MKTILTTLHHAIEIPATARHRSGRKPLLPRVRRLLWATALLLPAFAARADVVFTNLYSFTGTTNDGAFPQAALVQGSDGYFYGTTYGGGANGYGTVLKITTDGVLTTLYSFTGGNDGGYPSAALVQGTDGYFYGTTENGGNTNLNFGVGPGLGTVFKISTNGALTSFYSFSGTDGGGPAALVQGSDGYFYGTTTYGGNTNLNFGDGFGTVFKISPNGALTTLYSFGSIQDTNGNPLDGESAGGLVQGSDGYFYGTTFGGGTNLYYGTVFKISTNGAYTLLYSFGSIQNTNGNPLYPYPAAALVQGSDGYFYGTTFGGGNNFPNNGVGYGTVFKISPLGVLTTLYSFTGGNDGANPQAALVQGRDGSFYGTTDGGPNGFGSVFEFSTNGTLATLYSFTGIETGAYPYAALVQGSDGYFYGMTHGGRRLGAGTIFRLTIVPEIQALTLTNGTLNLTWGTEAGGTYQLQSSASLNPPNWTNLGSPVTATNGTLTFTDPVTNAPQRFYRVSLAQ